MTESNTSIAYADQLANALKQILEAGEKNDWQDDSSEEDMQNFQESSESHENEYLNYSQEQ